MRGYVDAEKCERRVVAECARTDKLHPCYDADILDDREESDDNATLGKFGIVG
ncbi:hypothetical protein [Halococcus sp. IIIV-5B]|uniref:hypothetical protein n=1 Tax=Halococcus sp. IIIV-5B TaxID=2321230 RepID=UPI0013142D2E|nr:hypothetical protein [Halococcus sp. IIIV-5B]